VHTNFQKQQRRIFIRGSGFHIVLSAEDRQKPHISTLTIAEKQGMKTRVCMPSPVQVTCACRWQLVQQRNPHEALPSRIPIWYLTNDGLKARRIPRNRTLGYGHGWWSLRYVQLNRLSQVWRCRSGWRIHRYRNGSTTESIINADRSVSHLRLHPVQSILKPCRGYTDDDIIVAPGVPAETDFVDHSFFQTAGGITATLLLFPITETLESTETFEIWFGGGIAIGRYFDITTRFRVAPQPAKIDSWSSTCSSTSQ
jgi:hypothetical protein